MKKAPVVITPRYLTPRQASEYMGISYQTLRNWKYTGKPVPVAILLAGTFERYDIKDLDAFMEERKTSANSISQ